MCDLYSQQEHCKTKLLVTIITGYYCIMIMELCNTIITLLHITILHIVSCSAVAVYFIDKLALRAGNEKDSDETADTVGCCSLRVKHLSKYNDRVCD